MPKANKKRVAEIEAEAKANADVARLYPEHAKLKLIQKDSQTIHEFILWLEDEHEIELAKRNECDDELEPMRRSLTDVVAEYFEIDLKKIDREKDQMLVDMRAEFARRDKEKSGG